MDLTARLSAWLLLLDLLTACVGAGKATIQPSPSSATTTALLAETPMQPTVIASAVPSSATPGNSAAAAPTQTAIPSCPVTLPNGKAPAAPDASGFKLGNEDGTLFTIPWPEGTVIFARDGPGFVGADGSLSMKWPWWRGVPGTLAIEGRRLDAPAPAIQAEIPDGYGDSGFQSTALIFPTQGCWEVTGKVGTARLTFVTLAVQVPFRFIQFNRFPPGLVSGRRDTSELPRSLRETNNFSNGGELITEASQDARDSLISYPAAAQQKVTVWGHPGICVQGAFANQQWQDNADAATLEWTADGSSYRISDKGLGLRCDDLLSMIYTPN